jgi:chaperonin cofactor prefoldin
MDEFLELEIDVVPELKQMMPSGDSLFPAQTVMNMMAVLVRQGSLATPKGPEVDQDLQTIYSLMREEDIINAVDHYKQSIMKQFDKNVIPYGELLEERGKVESEIDSIENKLKTMSQPTKNIDKTFHQVKNIVNPAVFQNLSVLEPYGNATLGITTLNLGKDKESYLDQLTTLYDRYDDLGTKLVAVLNSIMDDVNVADRENEERNYPVENIYADLFAFYYLWEQDYDEAWLPKTTINMMVANGVALPWDFAEVTQSHVFVDEGDTEESGEENGEETLPVEPPSVLTTEIDEAAKHVLYDRVHTYTDETGTKRNINLAQFIYACTRCVPVREGITPHPTDEIMSCLNLSEESKSILSIMIQMVWAKDSQEATSNYLCFKEAEDEVEAQHASKEEALEDQIESLKKEIASLKRENRGLRMELHQVSEDAEEVVEEVIPSIPSPTPEGEEQEVWEGNEQVLENPQIEFPYEPKSKIIVFGGHDAFVRQIKNYLPNVDVVNNITSVIPSYVRSADTVWIQDNAIKHSVCYQIRSICKANKIPLLYLGSSSARKCAEKIAGKDLERDVKD